MSRNQSIYGQCYAIAYFESDCAVYWLCQ